MRDTNFMPELFLVGAGPGDPELVTLKAYKVLQKARVVLYDNLANKELLIHCPDYCEKIYVGKKGYGQHTPQEVIHELIKVKAFEKGSVVRLKGGDPFIFGRGFEEMLFARENGIKTFYIPGITSMQTAGLEDIPLTHREVSESVWLITGTKKDGTLTEDLKLAIKSNATVVVYMGMKKLRDITRTYKEANMAVASVAVVQHGSLPHKKVISGRIDEIELLVEKHNLTHPAIIIIGKTVDMKRLKNRVTLQ